MAQSGRGWFHRRRHQVEPEPVTTPSATRPNDAPPPTSAPPLQASTEPSLEPAISSHRVQTDDVDHTAPVPSSPPAAADQFRAPSAAPRSAEGSPLTGPARTATIRPAAIDPQGSSNAQVPEHAPASSRPAAVIDWDAATAAALSDEPDAVPERAQGRTAPQSNADRLLEDIIREIVGDAAVDTASSLQPPRQTPVAMRADTRTDASEPASSDATRIQGEAEEIPDRGDSAEPSDNGQGHTVVSDPTRSPRRDGTGAANAGEHGPSEPSASDVRPAMTEARSSTGAKNPAGSSRMDDAVLPGTPLEPARPEDLVSRETMARRPDLVVSRETATEYGGTPLADQLADETRRRLALEEAVLPLPAHTRVLTVSNQKGGVGKTTTAVNLSAALARSGAHVLVIDLDPQGNASTALGVDHRSEQQSVYDVLVSDVPLADVVRPSAEHERLDCVPATIHLAGAEIELVSLVAREQRLRRALDRHLAGMERPYDYVLIDCPPSLGLLTINAFVAAREVLIPIQCEYYALEGLSQLLSNIELIEKHLNPELRLSTILLTMYDSRTNLAQQVAQEVREHFPKQTLDTIIPRSVRVSEAPSYGQSVISYDYTSSGSLSYREAAAEIAWRGTTDQKESH